MSTKNPLPFSNQFERGHSFNWADQGTEGKYYFNDEYVTDFVCFDSCVLACRKNHMSSNDNKPVIIYDSKSNTPIGVEGVLWSFVNSSIDGNAFSFLSESEYQTLVDEGLVQPHVLYFIYDDEI